MKNLVDFGVTTLIFWLFGYAFTSGPTIGGLIGGADGAGFALDFAPGTLPILPI